MADPEGPEDQVDLTKRTRGNHEEGAPDTPAPPAAGPVPGSSGAPRVQKPWGAPLGDNDRRRSVAVAGPEQPLSAEVAPSYASSAFASPYGGAYPAAARQGGSPPTDGVSITGFVLSLTCCLSIVGAILGFIGLGRTTNNQRAGRWAAISAIVIGLVGTMLTVGVVVWGISTVSSTRYASETGVGDCANRWFGDSSSYPLLNLVDCDDEHDGEVVARAEQRDLDAARAALDPADDRGSTTDQACLMLADPEASANVAAGVADGEIEIAVLADDADPSGSDTIVCFAESADGKTLTDPLLR